MGAGRQLRRRCRRRPVGRGSGGILTGIVGRAVRSRRGGRGSGRDRRGGRRVGTRARREVDAHVAAPNVDLGPLRPLECFDDPSDRIQRAAHDCSLSVTTSTPEVILRLDATCLSWPTIVCSRPTGVRHAVWLQAPITAWITLGREQTTVCLEAGRRPREHWRFGVGVTSRVIDNIRVMISSGELSPGDRLPPEHELAERLGVSRGSLREAVRALSQIKVLDVRRGDGTYVTSLAPTELLSGLAFAVELLQPQGLEEVLEVRRLLLPPAAALAAQRVTQEQLAEMHAVRRSARGGDRPRRDRTTPSPVPGVGRRRDGQRDPQLHPPRPPAPGRERPPGVAQLRSLHPRRSRSHTSECCSTPSSVATATWRSQSPPCRSTTAGAGSNTSATRARRGPMTRRTPHGVGDDRGPVMSDTRRGDFRARRGSAFGR